MISQPVFLVGAERSGTTLLRLMLDGHPQLAWNEEFEYAVDQMPEQGGWPDLKAYHRFLELDRIFLSSGFTADPSLPYPQLIDSFLVQKRARRDKPLVGATVHRHFDRLLRIWPDARFVHLIRDGRDVARSVIDMGWASNVWTGCDRWIDAEQLGARLSRDLPADRWMMLRFEDLIKDPVGHLTRVCAFCRVSYDPAMLDYPQHTTYGPPDPSMVMSWKRKLSPEEVALVEGRIGPMLVERGYELSTLPPRTVTPRMEKRLRRQDHWAQLRLRVKKLGPGLVLRDFLSRRLGLRRWQKKVQLQINALANAELK